jgi:hypothetical protein
MGKGFDSIIKEQKKRAEAFAADRDTNRIFYRRLRIQPGDTAVVRFLEEGEDVAYAYMGQLPARGNQRWGNWTPTRDQAGDGSTPCPLRERGITISFRGFINVIWRDAPEFALDPKGRIARDSNGDWIITGYKDQIALLEGGITLFTDLAQIDRAYHGLMSRDFNITRTGTGTTTRYTVIPADPDAGAVPLSAADKKLAKEKYDLNPLITPKSYEELKRLLGEHVEETPQAPVFNAWGNKSPFEDEN